MLRVCAGVFVACLALLMRGASDGLLWPPAAPCQVSAYHLTDFSPAPSPTNSNGLGWASHMGAAKPAGSGKSLLCFSRPVEAPAAAVSKRLDPTGGDAA